MESGVDFLIIATKHIESGGLMSAAFFMKKRGIYSME
jgi:hypothetical protein